MIKRRVVIYIIAGEISGDYIGSQLILELQNFFLDKKDCVVIGIGGSLMERSGLLKRHFKNIEKINIMGFLEVVPSIYKILKLIDSTVEDIINQKPEMLITIDSPGFTYRIAKKIYDANSKIKLLHIVAPSVWAYKPSRAVKYAKIYDCLLALLPFEPQYFNKLGLYTKYIGHPILDQNFYDCKRQAKKEIISSLTDNIKRSILNIEEYKIIAVTCGSRDNEVKKHVKPFIEAINIVYNKYPNIIVIFVITNEYHEKIISLYLKNISFYYLFSYDRLRVFAASDVALAKSGTNTLEIAASNTPMIVGYKINIFSYFIIKFLIKIKYVSLINIILDRKVIPEFLQDKCNKYYLSEELLLLLNNKKIAEEQIRYNKIALLKLGFKSNESASVKAASIIKNFLK